MRPIVIIESPYAGDLQRNLQYARLALRDSIMRGECPFASHLLYTQPGVLNDALPVERELGIELGFRLWKYAQTIAFYCDYGMSRGMTAAMQKATKEGYLTETRYILGLNTPVE